jgi:opacity protein-like surface antigen
MKTFLTSFLLFIGIVSCYSQVGYGLTLKTELYSRYKNPPDQIASPSAGSALLNLGIGPKIWFGGDNISFSPEASVVFSPFALSTKDYKGLGALSFPIMAKLHFLGMSNFNRDGKFGFAVGGGIQYTRTELFGLNDSFAEQGVNRKYFKTYIVEADFGFGLSGFDLHGLLRYGFNMDSNANTWSLGIGYDFNIPCLKEAMNSDF